MNKEEFKKYCEEHDDNLVTKWDYNKFTIICNECGKGCKVIDNLEYDGGSSCPTCGYDASVSGKIIVKCLNCGSAMQVLDAEELE